jgi:hypothetical protein
MQSITKLNRYSDALAATFHSRDNFCMDPYALAGYCQANASKAITPD